jgi:hypothetical protein
MFSALATRPGGTAATSAAARPILQLARKVFDNNIIARPLAEVSVRNGCQCSELAAESDNLTDLTAIKRSRNAADQ